VTLCPAYWTAEITIFIKVYAGGSGLKSPPLKEEIKKLFLPQFECYACAHKSMHKNTTYFVVIGGLCDDDEMIVMIFLSSVRINHYLALSNLDDN
jgi:hypothetical protein